ncbi:hypothetical protein ABW19_dt0207408 [Dactylella cylindrospora]|nr:hypothetical protein ABW19_dt0207408 [Dactylella cylindrospora]
MPVHSLRDKEYAIASATDDVTAISTVYETTTVTLYSTATDIVPVTLTVETTAYQNLAKRQQTDIPSSIPAYASACSGAVRYSSACSCIGVTPTIVTLEASTITVSADATVTQTTVTTTIIVATDYVTEVAATNTIVTTDATLTQSTTVATATHTNYISLSQRFAVQIVGGTWNGWYFNRENNGMLSVKPSILGQASSTVHLADGVVWSSAVGNEPLVGILPWITNPSIQSTYMWFNSFESHEPWPAALVGDVLKFYSFTTPIEEFRTFVCPADWQFANNYILLTPNDGRQHGTNTGVCELVTLKAVQVPF